MEKLTAQQVANYILWKSAKSPTPMKVQKLLYYSQGYCLAIRGETMFDEPIEAWDHGPVVSSIYHRLKHFRYSPVSFNESFDPETVTPEDRELIDAVLTTYGKLSAEHLSDLTHQEQPWKTFYPHKTPDFNPPMEPETLKNFFSELISRGEGKIDPNELRHQKRRELSRRMDRHRGKLREMARKRKSADLIPNEE